MIWTKNWSAVGTDFGATSVGRLKDKLKKLFRKGRGRSLARFIQTDLNPVLRGWSNYFRLTDFRGFAEELDQWMRRRPWRGRYRHQVLDSP